MSGAGIVRTRRNWRKMAQEGAKKVVDAHSSLHYRSPAMATKTSQHENPASSGQLAEQDPSPSVDRIDDLARRILKGDILLPKFQRDLVWKPKKILDLLDSVSKGFPIGSVLLWRTSNKLTSNRSIADLKIDAPSAGYPVNYLLDGQQRLSVICGSLHWNGTDPASRWNIAYDLRTQKFLHLDTVDEPPLHQIRLNRIPDPAAFFSQVSNLITSSLPDRKVLEDRAKELFRRFKDYKIATVTLMEMDIRAVAPIFERINSNGTVLTIVDLMRAATWDPEFDLIDAIEDILNQLHSRGFGNIESKYVLRSLSAAHGGGFAKADVAVLRYKDDVKPRREAVQQLKAVVANTKDAYVRMVDFLTTEIGVSTSKAVPYANQIVVLGELFRLIPKPTAAQFRAISEWFWRTTLSGYFAGWNTAQMATDLTAVRDFGEGRAAEIVFDVRVPKPEIWTTGKFGLNTAHAKLLALVLGQHKPVDLLTGQKIDTTTALAWSNTKEFHHFFPKDFLKKQGVPNERTNVLANFIMLTSATNKVISGRPPSKYLKDVQAAAGLRIDDWLASNLISPAAFAAALVDDYERFLIERAKTIHEAALKKANWVAQS
jgi:hypothetical protein